MSRLGLKESSDWTNLSTDENEMILCCNSTDLDMVVKARVVPFFGDRKELHQILKERVSSDAEILSYCKESLVFDNWMCDSYVCTGSSEMYRSFYYRILDKFYVVIEMLTGDNKASARFRSLVPSLIDSLDYSFIDNTNRIVKNGHEISLKTPSAFRYSNISNDDRLVFLGECKYLFVGIEEYSGSLQNLIEQRMDEINGGLDSCSVRVDDYGSEDGFEWARYEAVDSTKRCPMSYGTYFRQRLTDDCSITSFLLENGKATLGVKNILEFEGVS